MFLSSCTGRHEMISNENKRWMKKLLGEGSWWRRFKQVVESLWSVFAERRKIHERLDKNWLFEWIYDDMIGTWTEKSFDTTYEALKNSELMICYDCLK